MENIDRKCTGVLLHFSGCKNSIYLRFNKPKISDKIFKAHVPEFLTLSFKGTSTFPHIFLPFINNHSHILLGKSLRICDIWPSINKSLKERVIYQLFDKTTKE